MSIPKKLLISAVISAFSLQLWAQETPKDVYKLNSIVLYEANDQFGQRAGDAEPLSIYIKDLVATANTFFAKETIPSTFQIIVGVRPGNISHIWFISSTNAETGLPDLQKTLQAVKPINVSGLICFDIVGTIAGGDGKIPDPKASLPIPQEWKAAVKTQNKPITVDDLIDAVWPDPNKGDADMPPGVHYHRIDDAANAKVRAELAERFSLGASGVAKLFTGSPCVCGPGYWSSLKDRPTAKFKKAIPTKFNIPLGGKIYTLQGATIKEVEDLPVLADVFAQDVGTQPTIRKLTTPEIALFWETIPFDIQEPLYVLETAGHRYVICLVNDKTTSDWTIFWLDDLTGYGK